MEWLEKDPSFAGRYLAVEPLAELARAGDPAATTRYVAMLGGDTDWPVRARASALAGPVPAAHGALLHALDDAEPRVREAALRAVAEQGNSAAAVRVGALLAQDPWTFVRVAAANALGGMAAAPDLDRTLASAVGDASPRVRVEVLEALGRHRASAFAGPVRDRLQNEHELLDVRVAAVTTLGRMCDGESLDFFTKAARRLAEPFLERSELDLGVASVRALGTMHPKDLQRRLAPLLNKDVKASVREVATRALAEPAQCR
jgi:HEAT repeat protein